ncbi:type II secretion system minor pseudopilin GspI [Teredinibacter waterburyi]|uniref:type II secretion system minor pseudopilin GspI n=1 Tax=Teredinibacter waterburyi TaxID=1500538 RepID=UPI00165F5F1A|nr:type II secretion system minor pseudopilin GspI [Teredinibacter waterburyi]
MNKVAGFTLIEVLIALIIVGVALPALLLRVQSVSDHTGAIEEKTYAYWIASNKLEEITLDARIKKQIPKSERHDTIDYAGREWHWRIKPETTATEKLYRIEISVGIDDDSSIATLAGFVYDPN